MMDELAENAEGAGSEIILPGQLVANEPRRIPGCFVEHGKTYASVVSLLREGRLVPLKGRYLPTPGDYVVGVVVEERFSGYSVELHSPYEGNISSRETQTEFKQGDVLSAKIVEVNEVNEAVLVEPRAFYGGTVLEVDYVKVPRIIGRGGSMLEMIKQFTGTDLFVGKNGRIYLRGGNIPLASMAVLKIDAEAHTSGLTDRVKEFLEVESKKSV